jgi:bifunctional non-homologous end joining protein LigD
MIEMHPKLAMLAKVGDPSEVTDPVMEPKLDGWRMLAFVEKRGVRMFARSGVNNTLRLPAIVAALSELPVGTVLDGEVIAPNGLGGDWGAVTSALKSKLNGLFNGAGLEYVVFDILSCMGEDVRLCPLHVRRSYLETIFESEALADTPVELISQFYPYDSEILDLWFRRGYEGAIVKGKHGVYESGVRRWIKVKAPNYQRSGG